MWFKVCPTTRPRLVLKFLLEFCRNTLCRESSNALWIQERNLVGTVSRLKLGFPDGFLARTFWDGFSAKGAFAGLLSILIRIISSKLYIALIINIKEILNSLVLE